MRNNATVSCNYVKYAVVQRVRKPYSASAGTTTGASIVGCLEMHPCKCREEGRMRARAADREAYCELAYNVTLL